MEAGMNYFDSWDDWDTDWSGSGGNGGGNTGGSTGIPVTAVIHVPSRRVMTGGQGLRPVAGRPAPAAAIPERKMYI